MLIYHIKQAVRHLIINKKYSIINVTGLSIGFTVVILIGLFVSRELSYDNFHKQAENIYHFEITTLNENNEIEHNRHISIEYAKQINDEIPEIERMALLNFKHLIQTNGLRLSYKKDKYMISNLAFCDSAFSEVFDFETIKGNIKHASSAPGSIILTESLSNKIFGEDDPIGKVIHTQHASLTVNALIKDPPDNSTIQFSGLISYKSAKMVLNREITDFSNKTFILLNKNAELKDVTAKIRDVLIDKFKVQGVSDEKMKSLSFNLLPFKELYFRTPTFYENLRFGNRNFTYIMLSVGLIILIMAVINFIIVTTAQVSFRAKEIGIKKISGAGKLNIYSPFILESVILCLIALFFSRILIEFIFGLFNYLLEYDINRDILFQPAFFILTFIGSIIIGVVAGTIPLYYISQFNLTKILKEGIAKGQKGILLRKALLIFQFSITIILLVSTVLIKKQLLNIHHRDIGFKKDNCIEVIVGALDENHLATFKNDILQSPQISGYSLSDMGIGSQNKWGGELKYQGNTTNVNYYIINCDADYTNVIGFELVKGRNFSEYHASDVGGFILNETAVAEYGLKKPLEATLSGKPIIGIIKDFNIQSLHNRIEPVALRYWPKHAYKANIKINGGNAESISSSMKFLNDTWKKYSDEPFEYNFLDQRIDQLYKKEEKQFGAFSYFSIVAIVLSVLGLFGISTLSIELRTKEIGIRKVNGANIRNILGLLFKDFTILIVVSMFISIPIAWYVLDNWLERFAYKTSLSWWVFVLVGVFTFGIALLTVSFHSWKAARKNPVDALRYE